MTALPEGPREYRELTGTMVCLPCGWEGRFEGDGYEEHLSGLQHTKRMLEAATAALAIARLAYDEARRDA